jgi:uncharacterized membrane protein YdfJ with MMPL/SSD domain
VFANYGTTLVISVLISIISAIALGPALVATVMRSGASRIS